MGSRLIFVLVVVLISNGIASSRVGNVMVFSYEYKLMPERTCRKWIFFETAASMVLFGLTEFIQVLRGAFPAASSRKYAHIE